MPKRIAVDHTEPDPVISPKPVSETLVKPPEPKVVAQDATPIDEELAAKAGRGGMLSAFSVLPHGILFSGENEDEEILLLLRAHLITNVAWVVLVAVLILVPLFVLPLLGSFNVLPNFNIGMNFVLTVFWYMVVFTYAYVKFLYWYFNVYIVTNKRVVDIDWYSIIYRRVSSTPISNIQDASASQGGVIASIFDFGNVDVQTAGEEREFEFTAVPHPQLVAKKINELMQANQGGGGL